ncbi:PPM-type phosphatase domain-containing protein [Ruminococcaceae bacterium BL-6]|nr:PPM-type phosphatase domain-containing protein [Ruminococcaceae bacterium BL-6]
MAARIDAYGDCVNQSGGKLCGDRIEIVRSEAGVTAILADGRGGGAKAAMLASLAVKMMSAMLARGEPIEEIADMIVESQPAGGNESVDHSAFTILQVIYSGTIFISQMETPDVILLRRGKPAGLKTERKTRQGRIIRSGISNVRDADTIVAVGNGMLRAGAERDLKSGWTLSRISSYMGNAWGPRVTAEKLARLLLAAGDSLSFGKPKDDLSALVFRVHR